MAVSERIETVKKCQLCYNCLREGHSANQCPSKQTCRTCNRGHHTLLHRAQPVGNPRNEVPHPAPHGQVIRRTDQAAPPSTSTSSHRTNSNPSQQTILATAWVRIQDNRGQHQLCRAFLDNGSQSSFITESCATRLGLRRSHCVTKVFGAGVIPIGNARGLMTLNITPHFESSNNYVVHALLMPIVTGQLPNFKCDPTSWTHLNGLKLADPRFHHPANVDILLGGDIYWNLLLDERKVGATGTPLAVKTTLGWLVAGKLDSNSTSRAATTNSHCRSVLSFHVKTGGLSNPNVSEPTSPNSENENLDRILQQFWELEEVPSVRKLTQEEQACENHFQINHMIDASGRFHVKLPLKDDKKSLGSSYEIAARRLKQLERRLENQPDYRKQYNEFMNEYLTLGHMELVPDTEVQSPVNPTCFIPHHYVLKEESSTTKFRVVFDASAKTSNGVSLNDTMMNGPILQENLISIMMRFRKHRIAFTADIAKMYRQIRVFSKDADLQRILWRENPNQEMKEYRLLTVTYGTLSAPYLATKVLQQLAFNNEHSLPLASSLVRSDMYVDDGMSGESNIPAVLQLQSQLLKIMDRGCFCLRKWSSNSNELIESLPFELRENRSLLPFDNDEAVKTLGLHWCTGQDQFQFKVNLKPITTLNGGGRTTKRQLLSEISMVFDRLGWLAPVTIRAKIMFQQLWKLKLGWDEALPYEIQQEWLHFRSNLQQIEDLRINRCILPSEVDHLSLHGFCDASERAYSAVVYVRASKLEGPATISLICAKT